MSREIKDQRNCPRVRIKCGATVRGEHSWVMSICENISENGFFIRELGNEGVGSLIKLELELPDRDLPLVAEGRVVWRGKYNGIRNGGGIAFTRILKDDRKWLAEFVSKELSGKD